MGVSHRYFQEIESGRTDIKLSTLQKMAEKLDKPTCYFLNSPQNNPLTELGINCAREVLDILHVGVQLCDLNGRITYSNLFHRKMLGLTSQKIGEGVYIWDVISDPQEGAKLKEYFMVLVETTPEPTPYYNRNKTVDGLEIPIKVDWQYLRNPQGELFGFLSIITTHPSW